MPEGNDQKARETQQALLRWFVRHKRDLPWRRTKDPYRIWISEVMLQQTTVDVVIPYYERFLTRFPTVVALARASDDDVLSLWSGLGYYSRARNLRRAAVEIAEKHLGRFPETMEAALTLPGVGPYTARAVTSIAFGVPVGVVDGNVRRVLSRWSAKRELSPKALQTLADRLVDRRQPGAWNEAVMELGATVCLPQSPRCASCPVASTCRGRLAPHKFPSPPPKKQATRIEITALAIQRRRNGRDEFLLARTSADKTLTPLFELPHTGLDPSPDTIKGRIRKRYGIAVRDLGRELARVEHAITTRRITARLFEASATPKRSSADLMWFDPATDEPLPLGGMSRKLLRASGAPSTR